jgi:hypothetical protein
MSTKDFLVIPVQRTDGNSGLNIEEPDAILVEMSPAIASKLLAKMDLVKGLASLDPSIRFLGVRDSETVFVGELDEALLEEIEDGFFTHVALDPQSSGQGPGKTVHQDYLNIRVWSDDLCWRGQTNTLECEFESSMVSREDLLEIVKQK